LALLLQNNEHDYCKFVSFSKFVNLKNQGGLISASDSVFKIIQEADKMFLFLTDNFKSLHNNYVVDGNKSPMCKMYVFEMLILLDLEKNMPQYDKNFDKLRSWQKK